MAQYRKSLFFAYFTVQFGKEGALFYAVIQGPKLLPYCGFIIF